MGQNVCKCVKGEGVDGDSEVYTLLQPAEPTADARDHPPPPEGATEGDVVHDRDGERKKRRFWRKFWRKRAQDEREEHTIHQNTSAPPTADALDPSPPPAADIHEEVDENKDEGKKKKMFWKRLWRKGRRGAQSESEEDSDRSPEDHKQETPDLLREAGVQLTSPHPSVSHPSVYHPSVSHPSVSHPSVSHPSVSHPSVSHPSVSHPSVSHPSMSGISDGIWSTSNLSSSGSDSESENSFHAAFSLDKDLVEVNEEGDVIYKIHSCQYKMGKLLGQGGNGFVFEAIRVSDGLKVAVKIVQDVPPDCISIPSHPDPLQREIALHILANEGDHVPEIIQLLDWEDRDDKYFMFLEHPSPCMDLFDFIESRGGKITESLARSIMKQAIQAAIECFNRGVYHMDIKLENFLINTESFDIKLIDFGCGELLKETLYTAVNGTQEYWCPEFMETGEYHAVPTTVWSLGMMLFVMMYRDFPDPKILAQINSKDWKKDFLTKECCSFIHACLQKDPDQRIRLSDIFHHEWFHVRNVQRRFR